MENSDQKKSPGGVIAFLCIFGSIMLFSYLQRFPSFGMAYEKTRLGLLGPLALGIVLTLIFGGKDKIKNIFKGMGMMAGLYVTIAIFAFILIFFLWK